MKTGAFVLGLLLSIAASTGAVIAATSTSKDPSAAIDPSQAEAKRVVNVLAADAMLGRGNGTPEIGKARDAVRQWMNDAGATPGYDGAWIQTFEGPNGMQLENVVGRIEGSGDEWIVVGAHYDHLGVGQEGEFAGKVFPGADDNASGVAALLHLVKRLAAEKDLKRDIVLVAFAGEEIGLLGSRAFVGSPPASKGALVAMINLDTIGRLENERLVVFGSGTAVELPAILTGVNFGFGFDLAMNSEGAGASDHTPFFEKGVPVLHFFTGANSDYHRPTDRPDKVNVDGLVRVADFVAELTLHLAGDDAPLAFVPVGADKIASRTGSGPARRVSLGTIPDFAREKGGVRLQGVMPKSAAEEAGLETGDVIVAIGDAEIDTIDDFQAALAAHAPGDQVAIRFTRAGVTKSTDAVLRERK